MCVCVLFIYDFFFYIYIQQLFMCVCVCFNDLFIFNSSLNAPRTGIVGAQVTVGLCRVFGASLAICTD